MKGYKGMKSDMTCRGMKYEVGKTYHEDNIALCHKGLHFCKNLRDVFQFYRKENGNRFFEVEAVGNVIMGNGKCVTGTLTIIRELSEIEVNRAYYGYGNGYGYDNGFGNGYYCYNVDLGNSYCRDYAYGDGDGDGNGKRLSNSGKRIERYLIFKEV